MQIEAARKGHVTEEMQRIALSEGVEADSVLSGVASGEIVILHSRSHMRGLPVGIGRGLRTKVNANVGASEQRFSLEDEVEKARAAVEAGADTLMDLSTGGEI